MMTNQEKKKHAEDYMKHMDALNAMRPLDIDVLIERDECPFEPKYVLETFGQFHCPLCGEMVMAGAPHVRKLAAML